MTKWKKQRYNEVLNGDGFYVSYNHNTGNNPTAVMFRDMATTLVKLTDLKLDLKDGEETALCCRDGKMLILEGDFRKQYEEVIDDYEKCLEVYAKNIDKRSDWSEDKWD